MNLKALNILLAAVLAILIGIWLFLIMNPPEMRPPDIDKELGLNMDQIQRLGKIRDKTIAADSLIFRNIRELNKTLNKELSKKELDESAILSIEKDLRSQHEKLAGLRVSAIIESRRILGSDRFAKMTGLFDKRRKEGPMRWRPGPGGPNSSRNNEGREGGNPPPPPEFGF